MKRKGRVIRVLQREGGCCRREEGEGGKGEKDGRGYGW